jgi:hypothetical protein
LRQDIFVAFRRFLVRDTAQHSELNQFFQACCQQMPGDAERGLKRLEPPLAQKTFAKNQKGPAVADHRDGAGHRAGFFFERVPFHRILPSAAASPSIGPAEHFAHSK